MGSVALHLKLPQSCPGGYRVFFGRLQIAPPIPRSQTNHHETSRQRRLLSDFPGDPTKLKYVQNKFSMILAPHSKMSQLSASEPTHSRCARFVWLSKCESRNDLCFASQTNILPDFCMSEYLYIKQVPWISCLYLFPWSFLIFCDFKLLHCLHRFITLKGSAANSAAASRILKLNPINKNFKKNKHTGSESYWFLWILFWLLTVLDQSWPLWGSNVIAVFRSVSYAIHTELTLNPSKLSTSKTSLRIKLLTPMTKSLKNQCHIASCLCIQPLKFVPPVIKYLKYVNIIKAFNLLSWSSLVSSFPLEWTQPCTWCFRNTWSVPVVENTSRSHQVHTAQGTARNKKRIDVKVPEIQRQSFMFGSSFALAKGWGCCPLLWYKSVTS